MGTASATTNPKLCLLAILVAKSSQHSSCISTRRHSTSPKKSCRISTHKLHLLQLTALLLRSLWTTTCMLPFRTDLIPAASLSTFVTSIEAQAHYPPLEQTEAHRESAAKSVGALAYYITHPPTRLSSPHTPTLPPTTISNTNLPITKASSPLNHIARHG